MTGVHGRTDGTADPWVGADDLALLVDLYELTMVRAYWREGMDAPATFSLFFRTLPENRNYMLACGQDAVCRELERLRFEDEALDYLEGRPEFGSEFVDWLADFRFRGDVHAVPEGTPVFPDEPLLEVEAPLPQAQMVETLVMNQVHHQTVVASKAARVVEAAGDRPVVDFGLRRMHGADAGLKAARAFHVAGVEATSHVLAGRVFDVPVTGTMAHSYVQAHDSERDAFRAFTDAYPGTVLLVDTYDTLDGVRKVVELAREMGEDFDVRAVRLDSGDLRRLSVQAREIFDRAGLEEVEIFASGGLDEYRIADLVESGAPITGFGVGTAMGVAPDAPALDMAYKLTSFDGEGRMKLSAGKRTLPGRKQVFREERKGSAVKDDIGRRGEERSGRPLLRKVMDGGGWLPEGQSPLDESRARAREEIGRLPPRVRSIEPAEPPYPVHVSGSLRKYAEEVESRVTEAARAETRD